MSTRKKAPPPSSMRSGLGIDIPTLKIFPESSDLPFSKVAVERHPQRVSVADLFPEVSSSVGKPGPVRTQSDDSHDTRRRPPAVDSRFSLRSVRGMQGLLLAENGGGLVELNPLGGGSGFKQGTRVLPGLVTPGGGAFGVVVPPSADRGDRLEYADAADDRRQLSRHGTLLSQGVTPARNAAELKFLLGNSRSKVKSGAKIFPPNLPVDQDHKTDVSAVSLEQGKSRARVEVDILLDSGICVEGCYLTGKLHVKVKRRGPKDPSVFLGAGKIRVVGFEGIPDNNERHTFYQHAASLSAVSASSHVLYASEADGEGYSRAREGMHVVPFAMKLPVGDGVQVGAKGPFDNRSGIIVKYIAIASFKLKDNMTPKRSIAHFYRSCEVYPYLNASIVMAPATSPLLSTVARSLFLGGTGKLKLTASLHRNFWVAGQRCCVGLAVHNESKKTVKGLVLSLIRTTTVFHPDPDLEVASPSSADPDACQTSTTRKLVAETTLEAGQRGLRGHVTAKGWWTGVDPGARMNFAHFIFLPPNALSIVRSRLLEVHYAIRVSLVAGSLSSEVSVMLPIRIVNHLSIDPPPSYPTPFEQPGIPAPVPPLAIPISDPITSTSATSWNTSVPEGTPDGDLLASISNRKGARDFGASATAHQAVSSRTGSLASRMPMPQLTEEDPESESSSLPSQDLRGVYEDRTELQGIREDGDDKGYYEHEGDDTIFSGPVWADDLLGNLIVDNSDEEIDLVVGSARLEDDGQSDTRFTDLHTRGEKETHHVSQKFMKPTDAPRDTYSITSSRALSSQHAMRQEPGPVAHPRPRLEPKIPGIGRDSYISPTKLTKSSFPKSNVTYSGQSRSRKTILEPDRPGGFPFPRKSVASPLHQRSNFSQRVDRLVASRRANAQTPILPVALSITDDVTPEFSVDGSGNQTETSFSEITPASPPALSVPFISATPPHLRKYATSHSRAPVLRQTSTSPTANSVKSRIAELEEMCKVTSSSDASFIPI